MLIFAGCSFTDPRHHGYIENNIKVWPEAVANFRNEKYINVARTGASNDLIFNRAIDAIHEYEDKENLEVYVLWTSTARINVIDMETLFFSIKQKMQPHEKRDLNLVNDIRDLFESNINNLEKSISKHHSRLIETFNEYCDLKNIKVTNGFALDYFAGLIGYQHHEIQVELFKQLTSDYFKNFKFPNIKNNVGFVWPYISTHKLHISETNFHPNQEGHDYISDVFLGIKSGSFVEKHVPNFIYD